MRFIKPILNTAALAVLLAAAPARAEEWTRGEIRKVDAANQKLTIKHEYIRSIDMPPMTMVFTVADPALLQERKPGEAIRFVVEMREGKMLVTRLEPASP